MTTIPKCKIPDMVTFMKRDGVVLIEGPSGNMYADCPVCGSKKSMVVYPGRQVFGCDVCGKGGYLKVYIAATRKLTKWQAERFLERQAAIDLANELEASERICLAVEDGELASLREVV